ncbi:lysophospholipid acyltransferase family protein [Iodobacter fluviatilis]|uniref:KDO2-lipid IV(A) lauroyltransferase n=1 Tax=Iodobacter fluviatilis TaxID=537 RepID=A0A377STS1_9NEIS|nr:lipid A biosynthesis acyltransferase [Iodobacter fluviatilis]TCU87920.1 KDO2-lipid IV(A) lauroyltransferase [Iodobacter fluviatilis]STR45421.1 Lipid A biosynthesis lauroyl acyltransferase [Iodobacter fluviatilis]
MSYRLLIILFWCLSWLPLSLLRCLGSVLGRVLYFAVKSRRKIGLTNLQLCFPEWPEGQHECVLKQHYQELCTCIFYYSKLWFGSQAQVERLVRREGFEHFTKVETEHVIILAPHFLGLDFGGVRHMVDHRGASMYSSSHDNAFDLMLLRGRSRFNEPLLVKRSEGIRGILRAIKQGVCFYYLPDQDLGPKESVFVPFFGIQTATVPGLSRLALMGKAKVLPMITTLEKDGFVSRYYPAWENFPSDDALADTARMNAFIEERIREHPSQYYWLHRRFKTRPEGEASVY